MQNIAIEVGPQNQRRRQILPFDPCRVFWGDYFVRAVEWGSGRCLGRSRGGARLLRCGDDDGAGGVEGLRGAGGGADGGTRWPNGGTQGTVDTIHSARAKAGREMVCGWGGTDGFRDPGFLGGGEQ